jgi:hypothetical protein
VVSSSLHVLMNLRLSCKSSCKCNVWFGQATKRRKRLEDFFEFLHESNHSSGIETLVEDTSGHSTNSEKSMKLELFRNIKWAISEDADAQTDDPFNLEILPSMYVFCPGKRFISRHR